MTVTTVPDESLDRYGKEADPPAPTKTTFNLTDVGNAERLVSRHGTDLRYCFTWGRWLVWDGRRWTIDDTGEAPRRVKDMLRAMFADVIEIEDEKQRKNLVRHVLESERAQRVRATLELAQSEHGIPILPEHLDADPWIFNCQNGTIDLRTGTLEPHTRETLVTKIAPVDYDPTAAAPLWRAHLKRVLPDPQLRSFLQRLIGYALVGVTTEQILPIWYGGGANGKTVTLETLLALFGDYGQQTPAETFLERRNTIPNDVARLRGARLVGAAEVGEDRRLAEATVKAMTGGDTITARYMRGEWFEFPATFTAVLLTNHKPVIRGTDEAIWRRIRLIPFTVTIPESERDPDLAGKLRDELRGILAWAVQGCLAWQQDGLGIPEAVQAATAGYREEQDDLGGFLTDKCILATTAKAKASELWTVYGYWCAANGINDHDRLSQKALGQRLAERGLNKTRTGDTRWWNGIGLLHEGDA